MKGHLSESLRSLVDVFRNRDLRRLQLAWIGSIIGNWAYLVALVVYAYDQGGPAAVGIVGVLRMLPAAFAAPIVATLADRYPRKLVLIGSDLIRAVLMVLAGLTIYLDWTGSGRLSDRDSRDGRRDRVPARTGSAPALARPDAPELTAANVASSTFESVGSFAGPALGGLLLAATNAETVFLFNGAHVRLVGRPRGGDPEQRFPVERAGEAPWRPPRCGDVGRAPRDLRQPRPADAVRPLHGADTRRRGAQRPRRRVVARVARHGRRRRRLPQRRARGRRADRRLRRARRGRQRPPRGRLRDRRLPLRRPSRRRGALRRPFSPR